MRKGSTKSRSRMRWVEYAFLLAGLIALDCFIWVNVDARLYESYENWRFERVLRGDTASIPDFILYETGLGGHTAPDAQQKAESKGAPQTPARRAPSRDDVIGRINIPRLNVRVIVREGVNEGTLQRAVGHIPATALPGQQGNVGLAAHRDTFFRPLRNIRRNDVIYLSTLNGEYQYSVETTQIVKPDDVSVLNASSAKELTLVTCYPFYYIGSAPKRFIVHARQVAYIPLSQERAQLSD